MKKYKRTGQRRHAPYSDWRETDLSLLRELLDAESSLPPDAPRALVSVRLSASKAESTSPVRQELDLRLLARERGYRVVGVASDLNVSATRVPPWKRVGRDGNPIKVADPILTEAQWQSLQGALRKRAKTQPARQRGGATEFLGVLVCADCGTNMTVHRTTVKQRGYAYLRCRNCPSGGLGAPDPEAVYRRLADEVVTALGAEPVRVREYQPGVAGLARPTEGDGLKAEAARGRWVEVRNGDTFRDHWERGGRGVMADDLRRAGITCEVSRHKRPRVRAPEVRLKLTVPEDARERLVVKTDVFADK